MDNKLHLKESETSRTYIFKGKVFDVATCTAELYDKREVYREIILHNGGVGILPVDNDGCVYLVEQYRYAVGDVTLEIPAGKLEKGESPEVCAERELSEETGFKASNITYLGKLYASPAILSENIYVYLARGLSSGDTHFDDDEELNIVKIKLEDAVKLVIEGKIIDAKTQIALLKASKIISEENEQ